MKDYSMKITHTILALLAAGFVGQSAFGSDNNAPQLNLAITPDGHGGSHFQYYQSAPQGDATSVALATSSGGVADPVSYQQRNGPQPDQGQVKFVTGTNQHGQANSAYIPMTSHFSPGGQ